MRRRLSILLALAASAAALAVSGCGGDDGGGEDPGPAAAVPASAPLYLDFTIKPEGAAKTGAEAALKKIVGTEDPTGQLIALIEQSADDEGEKVDFAADVEPWLGQKAAVFFTNFEDDADGSVVIEATDTGAAQSFLDSQKEPADKEATYEGVDYDVDADGDASGVVGDFVISGSEQGFKDAVDAVDGDSLGDSGDFKSSLGDLPEDRLMSLYALPKNILDAIPAEDLPASTRDQVEKFAGDAIDEPILGDLTATAEGVAFELSAGNDGVETEESSLLSELPAQAWLGLGFGDIGDSLKQGLESAKQADIPNFDPEQISSQVQAATGHDLDEIAGSLGQAALFVEGTSMKDLGGALVVQANDPTVVGDLLTKLTGLISQGADPKDLKVQPIASTGGDTGFTLTDTTGELAQPVTIIQRGEKLVIGYGQAATGQALEGGAGQTLEAAPAFAAAKGQLTDLGVDAFLSFAPVFALAESQGATADPDYLVAKPYIDALDYVALGSGTSDDRALLKFVIGLK